MMGTINTAKRAFNWISATRRDDACQRCAHVERRMTGNITTWWCKRLNVYTSALAICDQIAIQPEEARHG
ncbi:MAG: hypothetical protein IPG66_05695 [Hydrogenophilales bacterium]|nr:hypothetical protein [Hydrogenophilales bacterium]